MTSSPDLELAAALAADAAEAAGAMPDDPAAVRIERVGPRQYVGYNGRGAVVHIGSAEHDERFTPGELLKLALLGCTGLSTDVTLARRLGDDYAATLHGATVKNAAEERYTEAHERLEVDLSALEPDAAARLLAAAGRAVDKSCTVGRTVQAGADVHLTFVDTATGASTAHVAEEPPR